MSHARLRRAVSINALRGNIYIHPCKLCIDFFFTTQKIWTMFLFAPSLPGEDMQLERPLDSSRPAQPRSQSPSPAPRGEREILQSYLDDIFDTPVMDTASQNRIFAAMNEAETTLRTTAARVPEVARGLIARWHERQANGRVTTP